MSRSGGSAISKCPHSSFPCTRKTRSRSVHDRDMMKRELTWPQGQVNCLGFVYVDRNLLPTRQHIVRAIGFALWQLRSLVSAWDDPHAAILRCALRKSDPGR